MRSCIRVGGILILSLSLLIATQLSQSESVGAYTKLLSAQGMITYSEAQLVFQANFDAMTGTITGTSIPGLGIGNWLERAGPTKVWIEDGSQSGIPMRRGRGTKCLGLEVLAQPSDPGEAQQRNEFIIRPRTVGIDQKAYIATWLYLPSDWALYSTTSSNNWYEITNVMSTDNSGTSYYPMVKNHFHKSATNTYYLVTDYYPSVGNPNPLKPGLYSVATASLPRGRWFQLRWFIDRTTGTVQSWIYDQGTATLLGSQTGLNLGYPATTNWYSVAAKIYGNLLGLDYKIWCDGFEVWDGIP